MSYLKQFTLLAATAALSACVTPAKAPEAAPATPSTTTAATPPPPPARADATATSGTVATPSPPAAPREVKTRHALFKAARFDELPGWASDDLSNAWDAFRASCRALDRREAWRTVCESFAKVPRRPAEMRRFFEREFTLLQILNTDATREGEVTGYYEPLIAGSTRAEGRYAVPVYGTPNDLFTIDWKSIPAPQRRAVVHVVAEGRELVVVPSPRAGSVRLDTSQFELDTRDRRWRVRVAGGVARPYAPRDEIEAASPLDAPVIAWVDDALALYAMQVQGSGRIQLRDGRVLRVQYAEQNGHPFRPLRLARAKPGGASRGLDGEGARPDSFELADLPAPDRDDEA
ncbi:MAG TPA: MltA domain-containing protein, partial [Albitalea sp.]